MRAVEARLADVQDRADAGRLERDLDLGGRVVAVDRHPPERQPLAGFGLDHDADAVAVGSAGTQRAAGLGGQLDVVAEQLGQLVPDGVGRGRQLDAARSTTGRIRCNSWVAR